MGVLWTWGVVMGWIGLYFMGTTAMMSPASFLVTASITWIFYKRGKLSRERATLFILAQV